jgi:hypothetical protein
MFFVDVIPDVAGEGSPCIASIADGERSATEPPPKPRFVCVQVDFQGTRCGRMRLGLEPELAAYCHEGFQPDDLDTAFSETNDGPETKGGPVLSGGSVESSILELANIVCGSFLSNAWPNGLFRVEEPRMLWGATLSARLAADAPNGPMAASCAFQTTEGRLEARIYLELRAE